MKEIQKNKRLFIQNTIVNEEEDKISMARVNRLTILLSIFFLSSVEQKDMNLKFETGSIRRGVAIFFKVQRQEVIFNFNYSFP